MFFTDRMIVARDGVFHITQHRIDPFEGRLLSTEPTPAGDKWCMCTSRLSDGLETG